MIEDKPHEGRTILVAVVTAALTSLATGLVTWGLEELKTRRKSKAEDDVNPG